MSEGLRASDHRGDHVDERQNCVDGTDRDQAADVAVVEPVVRLLTVERKTPSLAENGVTQGQYDQRARENEDQADHHRFDPVRPSREVGETELVGAGRLVGVHGGVRVVTLSDTHAVVFPHCHGDERHDTEGEQDLTTEKRPVLGVHAAQSREVHFTSLFFGKRTIYILTH